MMPPPDPPPAPDLPVRWGDKLGRLGRLVRKELFEILRDRRTIITLVLMPVLLYPLLFLAFQQFLLAHLAPDKKVEFRLGFLTEDEGKLIGKFLDRHRPASKPEAHVPSASLANEEPALQILVPNRPEDQKDPLYLENMVRNREVDLGIHIRNLPQALAAERRGNWALDLELVYREDSAPGREARAWLRDLFARANTQILEKRLRPLGVRQHDVPLAGESQPNLSQVLAVLVPLILILMTITGAVYPAIDLTAGERERGTLEILVAAPVPRLGLLFAKYVTVLAVAMLTALANVVMMTLTLVVTGLGPRLFGDTGVTPGVVLQVLGLMLLFAAFFSGVLLTVASFSRSFKEAQAYLIPLMLVSLTPGMAAVKPDLHLSVPLAVAPLINIVLLARDVILGKADLFVAGIVVLSTLLYALAALALAARIFGAEGVLNSDQGTWADLFRRPAQPRPVATVGGVLLCLALLFPAYFVLNGLLGQWLPDDPGVRLGSVALASVALFAGFPLLGTYLGRVRLVSGWQLYRGPWLAYPAAVLLGLSLWAFVAEIQITLERLGWTFLGAEQKNALLAKLRGYRELGVPAILFVFALVVPVCEEVFFRGYLFAALRAHTSRGTTLLGSALLFGLFHVMFTTFDRFIPTTLLGLVLGWVCWQARSIFPGIVLHACHNGLLFLAFCYEEELRAWGWYDPNSDLPAAWLLGAGVAAALGAVLLRVAGRKPRAEAEMMGSAAEAVP
jgi:ABC-2 type transport system permease protein/sodium transport system permease protein